MRAGKLPASLAPRVDSLSQACVATRTLKGVICHLLPSQRMLSLICPPPGMDPSHHGEGCGEAATSFAQDDGDVGDLLGRGSLALGMTPPGS